MVTHSSILAWRMPWTEEPSGLESMESQIVGHCRLHMHTHTHTHIDTDMDADLAGDCKGAYLSFTSQPLPVCGIVL